MDEHRSDSLDPELDGTLCSVDGCFGVADVLGQQTVVTPAHLGHFDEERTLLIIVPLCIKHGEQLRDNVDSCDFRGLPD